MNSSTDYTPFAGPLRTFVGLLLFLIFCLAGSPRAEAQVEYLKPSDDVVKIIDSPWNPRFRLSPDGLTAALVSRTIHPPIAQLARPFLALGGLRIDPATNAPRTLIRYQGITLKDLATGKDTSVVIPGDEIGIPIWRNDSKALAVERHTDTGTDLWIIDPADGSARNVPGLMVNHTLTSPLLWMPDNRHLLVLTVPVDRGAPPEKPKVPTGPQVEETSGVVSQMRTYQDLLRSTHDDRMFKYYCTSRLVLVDSQTLKIKPMDRTGMFLDVSPSPGGKYLLSVEILEPFSHRVPYYYFRRRFEVMNLEGKIVHAVATSPASEDVPRYGVPVGVRNFQWMPGYQARLFWTEATDGGDPTKDVPFHDSLWSLEEPFTKRPLRLTRLSQRFSGIDWLDASGRALVHQYDRKKQWWTVFLMNLDTPPCPGTVVFDLSAKDAYKNPGEVVMKTLPGGHRMAVSENGCIFLDGKGSSPKGDLPFLSRLDLSTLKTKRIWQCPGKTYEEFSGFYGNRYDKIITWRQTPKDPPNFFLVDLADGARRQLTHFADPAPWLSKVKTVLVKYKRYDGLPLSGLLYLPPGYKKGTRLPLVMWAYPREYANSKTAGQVRGSQYKFTRLYWSNPRFFLAKGYAFFQASMPLVGDPDTVNNTFKKQIVENARAAIDKLSDLGYADRKRVLIGGHSYGAFMTANLMAHCDLFAAGIARSGAYNRTLTPFGFQSERRTLWEAPRFYLEISPITHADKIKQPLLLIHGLVDSNSGTYPLQSRRMFQAIKGNGGTARLVMLPLEGHGYYSRESNLHVLQEMFTWADRFVKNRDVKKKK